MTPASVKKIFWFIPWTSLWLYCAYFLMNQTPSASDDGISIPESYTSFLAPLSSAKLFSEVRVGKDPHKHPEVRVINASFSYYKHSEGLCMFIQLRFNLSQQKVK